MSILLKSAIILLWFASSAAFGAEDTSDYDRYHNEIVKLHSAARYGEALSLAGQFADLARSRSGSESLYYARATSWKALLNLVLGRHDQSERLFEEALAIYQKDLKADDPELARAISNLGMFQRVRRSQGGCRGAIPKIARTERQEFATGSPGYRGKPQQSCRPL